MGQFSVEISRVAGSTLNGNQHRDFIIECRLERAHKKLFAGERCGSVTEIALDSGFSDLSHFSAKYRSKYGEAPSETLRAAMK